MRAVEAVVAVFSLHQHFNQALRLQPVQMDARSRWTDFRYDRQLRTGARMAVHQAIEHARACRFANCGCNSGGGSVAIISNIHCLIVSEVFMQGNRHTACMSMTRREAIGAIAAVSAALATGYAPAQAERKRTSMTMVCVIRYQIDPYQ